MVPMLQALQFSSPVITFFSCWLWPQRRPVSSLVTSCNFETSFPGQMPHSHSRLLSWASLPLFVSNPSTLTFVSCFSSFVYKKKIVFSILLYFQTAYLRQNRQYLKVITEKLSIDTVRNLRPIKCTKIIEPVINIV